MGRSGYYANQPVVGAVTARLLMLALARGGNFAEALHVYERLRGCSERSSGSHRARECASSTRLCSKRAPIRALPSKWAVLSLPR